jgi:hypothetical protein
MQFRFTARLWQVEGDAAWHFLTLPKRVADDIEDARGAGPARGFGSVPVQVQVGTSTWKTSVFPSTQESSFVLPVKKAVRDREGLAAGDQVEVRLTTDLVPSGR